MANPLPRIPADIEPRRNEYLLQRIEEAREKRRTNPKNHGNLLQLGAALLELSQSHTPSDPQVSLDESIDVLDEAHHLNKQSHNTMWLLGSAYALRATRPAHMHQYDSGFASMYLRKAHEGDPGNPLYARTVPVDRMEDIREFFIDNWQWGALGATALAGICAAIWGSQG
ncbi:mitochondrial import receptor subunit TOM20-2-like [Papaver somniferum]|uniref:mitochondrial import receptor subunit TOM20-2-like n=1 Tax=Papaver somniferum TaxID=3469 RepID=UPI000E6F7B55|nr:mitochondrial import receptor subunit TOM20-2-like [Papaver somniferum]